jgi:uncharacterized repeat protein (TIGR01451 family)
MEEPARIGPALNPVEARRGGPEAEASLANSVRGSPPSANRREVRTIARHQHAVGGVWNRTRFQVQANARRRALGRWFRPSGPAGTLAHLAVEGLEERVLLTLPVVDLSGVGSINRLDKLVFVDGSGPIVVVPSVTTVTSDSFLTSAVFTIDNARDDPTNITVGPSTPEQFQYGTFAGTTATQTVDAAGKLTLTLSIAAGVTTGQMLSILESVSYIDSTSPPTPTERTVDVTVTNSTGTSGPAQALIDFKSTNSPPKLATGAVNNLALTVGTTAATSLGLGSVTYDPQEPGQTMTYTVTAVPPAALGQILLADTTVVTAGTSYSLTDLQGMQFQAHDATTRGSGNFTFQVQDNGGTLNGGNDTLTQALTIVVNTPPVIVLGPAPSYTEGDPATAIAPGSTVTQPDSLADYNGGSLTATILAASLTPTPTPTGPFAGQLVLDTGAGSPFTLNGNQVLYSGNLIGTQTIAPDQETLTYAFTTASTTPAVASALISHIQYVNATQDPVRSLTVEFQVDNGHGGLSTSLPADQALTIHRVNNPPVVTVPPSTTGSPITLVETPASPTPVAIPGVFAVSDLDAEKGTLTVTFSVGVGTVTIPGAPSSPTGKSVTITDTLANLTSDLAGGVQYTSQVGYVGTDTLTVVANDNGNTGDAPDNQPLSTTAYVYLSITSGVALTSSAPANAYDAAGGKLVVLGTTGAALVGENVTYTIVVTNNGPNSSNVTLTDTIPANSTLVSGNVNDAFTIPSHSSATRTIVVAPTAGAAGLTITNLVHVAAAVPSDSPADVSTTNPVGIVQITATPNPVQEVRGQTVTAQFIVALVTPAGSTFNRTVNVTASLDAANTTAVAGTDYTGPSFPQTVSISGTQPTQSIPVSILDNMVIETAPLTLALKLALATTSNPPAPAALAGTTLTILDGDAQGLVVTTTADNGNNANPTVGSLRAAIITANKTPLVNNQPNVISFSLAASPRPSI